MENEHQPDEISPVAARDQRAAYDELRGRCPVMHGPGGWTLFRHEDVRRVLHDHETFSNAVSQHLSVPNGMDPPEHTEYRRIIEPYFSAQRMSRFEPICRDISRELVRWPGRRGDVEFMAELASPFGVHVQCAFLGWPTELRGTLASWMRRNQEATRARDRPTLSAIAREFERIIDDLLDARREARAGPEQDITASLMHERVHGRPLSNEELASILRNWTAGEIGTISAAVGILAHYLATHPDLQSKLRAQPQLLAMACDEILRINGPLLSNRRITTRTVELGGRTLGAGEGVTLNWVSANRDERVFDDPDEFRLDRKPAENLLYGAGIHICPGAPLARLELRVFMEELLRHTQTIEPSPEKTAQFALPPASGFGVLPLRIR
jgi:cytochrome P450